MFGYILTAAISATITMVVMACFQVGKDPRELLPLAHWEPVEELPGFVRCSFCRDCYTVDDWPNDEKWKFCPQCGAVMEGTHGNPENR